MDGRPDPEELLDRVKADEARVGQGALKIFFGAAPGVGKTFAMLESARRLEKEGVDVVVGCVETHGRAETAALVEGLEALPMRSVEYRGATLREFDLDGALKRKPGILLLDELAHTNAPGSLHKKRWQDVMDLLDAGIDVHTTLNVQHVESLNDVVREVTQVRVRETVPDRVLERADEIELVDLPPDDLLQRLSDGKVYLAEQAARAKERFFRRGNLLALRELALRQTAQHVDSDVREYRKEHAIATTWASGERILVAVGPSPASAALVRAARRMADRLRAPWIAASVESTTAAMTPRARARLDANLGLAADLGAAVLRLTSDDIPRALIDCAAKQNVTRIVIGKPTHSRLRDFVRGSLLDAVVRGSGNVDVLVTSGTDDETRPTEEPRARPDPPKPLALAPYALATLGILAVTGLGVSIRARLDLADVVMLYLLAIGAVAMRFGRWPSVFTAALAVGALDFFFVPPLYELVVTDARHVFTFAMMFVVGVLLSGLMLRIRRQERAAWLRAERTAMLYALTRAIAGASSAEEIARVVRRHVETTLECDAAVWLSGGAPESIAPGTADRSRLVRVDADRAVEAQDETVASWVLEHGRVAGLGTDTLAGAKVFAAPMASATATWGVIALRPRGDDARIDREQRDLLDALLRQAGLAIERTRLAEEARVAALRAKTEELRASLLSAVSHDLRTPLAAITGAATSLLDASERLDEPQRVELLTAICDEADHLERLLTNLLDMTRIDSGGVAVKREWVPIEEVVGSALARVEKSLAGRPLEIHLPADLPLVAVDPVVFGQVFVNLLENAAKYTPDGSPIEVGARRADGAIEIDVADHGPGIPEAAQKRVFEKFYRGVGERPGGVGLGLAICRGIVEAHGGAIAVTNRPGGGALFRISLPLVESPPVPSEPPPPGDAEAAR
ncbi:MAG: sensor histidine kinase KdpD [Polyangiaceae bacterium]